ncbi:EAL domain-containing protein [Lysobacter sp. A421]
MLVLVTYLLAGVTVAGSADTRDRSPIPAQPSTTTIVVGGDREYPPFQFLDDEGEARGFDVELIRAVLEPQGLAVRFELGEWDIALERLDRGEVDVVPMFASPERAKRFLFSKPYMLRYHAVFGHRDSPLILSLEELSGHRVAVQHASLALEALGALPLTAVEIVQVDVEADALAAVKRGEADYALVPTGIGLYATANAGMTDIIALGPPLLERSYVFAVRRDRPELVPIIDAGLDRVRASGERERLYEAATLGRPVTADAGKSWLWAVLVLSGLCLALLIPALVWWRSSGGVKPSSGTYYHAGLEPDPGQLILLSELRQAIANKTLGYALQPKLDLETRRWVGVELLVRWHHPRRGPLAPEEFIPLAERAGVTRELTLYLVGCALKHCRQWREQGHPLTIAVNVSANDLDDPELVSAIIAATGDLGSQLLLELTETDVMRDPDKIVDAITRLRPCGIRISIDDFGTGYSSLTNLRLLDADELKIDRTFVLRLLQSTSDQAIVHATIRLAHDLGVQVTAEGVEDEATLAWLANAGCDRAQGFAIAHPMSPEAFAALLEQGGPSGLPVQH